MMKDAARVEAKRVVVAEERGCRCGGIMCTILERRRSFFVDVAATVVCGQGVTWDTLRRRICGPAPFRMGGADYRAAFSGR